MAGGQLEGGGRSSGALIFSTVNRTVQGSIFLPGDFVTSPPARLPPPDVCWGGGCHKKMQSILTTMRPADDSLTLLQRSLPLAGREVSDGRGGRAGGGQGGGGL